MTSKHITRDYSAHKKSVIRPYDEYCGLEIFSYDPKYTKSYITNNLNNNSNAKKTSFKHWNCFISSNKKDNMIFNIKYNAIESGEYRLDFLYEQSNHIFMDKNVVDKNYSTSKDLLGTVTIDGKEQNVVFDGENNILKRITIYETLNDAIHNVQVSVPPNCYFIGVIIRKLKKYTANNYFGGDSGKDAGNMMLLSASVTNSDMVKPTELQLEIGYDDAFECYDSPSGFYIDYRDEVNYYVKDNDGEIERVFGGYVSSILPNDDRTKLTIHCADRLVDGQNKYILDEMVLGGGTTSQSDDDYLDYMTKNFKSYNEALKYLCDIHENTLQSNINNYLVDGEKYKKGFTIKYGKKNAIKSIPVTNGYSTPYDNFILLRNKPSSEKAQTWTLYDGKKHSKLPVNISEYDYMHISYGMGSPKTEIKTKVTETVDTADTTVGSQKFTKCGVSADKKYVMFIGIASKNATYKKYGNQIMKRIYKNKCPYCGKTGTLRWDDSHGNKCIHGKNKSSVTEGEITCISCDCDFDGVGGVEKMPNSSKKLTPVTSPTKSSVAERNKLSSGKMVAVPETGVSVTPDEVFKKITTLANKYKYKRGSSSTYSNMKKTGYGDCWAFSELILTELKKYDVSCKIVEYHSNSSDKHRSVLYLNTKNKYVDFPYQEYGWNKSLYATSGSKNGRLINQHKGHNIGKVEVGSKNTSKSQTTTITTTKNYDKDKPFKGYMKLTYSQGNLSAQSWNAKTYNLYIGFTEDYTASTSMNGDLKLYWVNNTVKKATLKTGDGKGLISFLRNIHGEDANIFLHSIHMIAPKKTATKENEDVDWYKYDNQTHDESSCKMNLYQIVFNDEQDTDPSELKSCGKSVNNMLQELVKETGHQVDMTYGVHRKDDRINFHINNQTTPRFVATEGDDNNILNWGNISYNPINSLYNISTQVYKDTSAKYYYISTGDATSVLNYGEQCVLATSNQPISDSEAYYNARMNEKYNSVQTYSYTITVPNYPDVRLGDLVKVVANAKKLSTIKEIKSIKIVFDNSKIPRIRTELGLDELAPNIQLKQNIRNLRTSAKKETTSFSKSATPVSEQSIYEWE